MQRLAGICCLALAVVLAGCAGVRRIDSQVTSFAPLAVSAGASYRFERLPSQQADADALARLEAMAEQALAKVGLRYQPDQAQLVVQVASSRRVQRISFDGGGWGLPLGRVPGHAPLGGRRLFPGLDTQTLYLRELSLIVRDSASHRVLFETYADNDNPWSDDEAVLPAMLDAALQGFPTPPTGVRRIPIDIPR